MNLSPMHYLIAISSCIQKRWFKERLQYREVILLMQYSHKSTLVLHIIAPQRKKYVTIQGS